MNRLLGKVLIPIATAGHIPKRLRPTLTEGAKLKMGSVEETIRQKLTEKLAPLHLNVINESSMHNVPKGSETHFKVVVVSESFENLPLIQRHRLVNDTLKDELAAGVHALSMVTLTAMQWEERGGKVEKSPACLGGNKR